MKSFRECKAGKALIILGIRRSLGWAKEFVNEPYWLHMDIIIKI
jgi:hypothetical protein